jgi:hypothetical protein
MERGILRKAEISVRMIPMKGAKTMNKLRFVAAVASLAASVAVLYGDSYDSYVHLNAKEGPTNPSFFDNTSGHWQKKNEEGVFQAVAEGPHSGEKYYVPTGSYLATSNVIATAASPVFANTSCAACVKNGARSVTR